MKRDMSLIRELLLKLEGLPLRRGDNWHITPDSPAISIEGYSVHQIDYHLSLIREAGFIDDSVSQPAEGIMFTGLSWRGHEFLDAVRDPEIWRKTTETAKRVGAGTIDLFWGIAKEVVKAEIKRHTGFDV